MGEMVAEKKDKNTGMPWTHEDISILRKLLKENKSSRFIGYRLGRSSSAVRSKARDLKISLTSKCNG
jgi:hypothetical protein